MEQYGLGKAYSRSWQIYMSKRCRGSFVGNDKSPFLGIGMKPDFSYADRGTSWPNMRL